jgi:hypothetical protein
LFFGSDIFMRFQKKITHIPPAKSSFPHQLGAGEFAGGGGMRLHHPQMSQPLKAKVKFLVNKDTNLKQGHFI